MASTAPATPRGLLRDPLESCGLGGQELGEERWGAQSPQGAPQAGCPNTAHLLGRPDRGPPGAVRQPHGSPAGEPPLTQRPAFNGITVAEHAASLP